MSITTQAFNKSSIHERLQLLRNKLETFGIFPDTWLTLDTFMDHMNKLRDWRKLDKRIAFQVFNNTDKGPNGTFQLEKFFKTYLETLDCLQHQKEAAQIYLKKLNDHKGEACNTLEQIHYESSLNPQAQTDSFFQIEVFEAKELNLNPNEQVYIRIGCEHITVNTQLASYNNGAKWNEKFKIPIQTGLENINIILMSKSLTSGARILGSIQLPIASLKDQQLVDTWFSLNYQKNSSACNKVRFGLQWIYSKVLYLQSTIEKLNEHIKIQLDDIEEFERELHEMDNLIPLVIIDPTPVYKDQSINLHLSPKRLNFETEADVRRNDKISNISQQASPPMFKPPLGLVLSTNLALNQVPNRVNTQLGSPVMKMTLPSFDQQCSQDQNRSMPNSPRIFSENENKVPKPESQAYLKKLFNASSPMTSPTQSTRTTCIQEPNDLYKNDVQQKLDMVMKENQKLRMIIEEIKGENENLKQEKGKISNQYEGKMHMLVDEVERLGRAVAEKNKEIETLKNQNKEKSSVEELENRVRVLTQENRKLNQLTVQKTKESPKATRDQDENRHASVGPAQRKKEIFSVGPKFLKDMEKAKTQQSQSDLHNINNFNKTQVPLQTRENMLVQSIPVQSFGLFGPANPKIAYRNGVSK